MLFSSNRQAIYIFENDRNGKTVCYDECAEALPPVFTEGEPVAVLYTDDLHELAARWRSRQVHFRVDPYESEGTQVCHVLDLYGNEFVAVQLAELTGSPPARFGTPTEWFGPLDQATEVNQPGQFGEPPTDDRHNHLQ